ncbi:hypothetical protein LTR94_032440, partial [Friedmanniomyces endolithicus]
MLTSLDDRDLADTGVGGSAHDHVMRLADLARAAGLDGIVCSGVEVQAAHRAWPKGFFVVPGVRPANGAAGDQKRVVTPRQALDDGASILVIGRPITQAEDPDAAARAIEASGAQALWVQHEYGIFGGEAGAHILSLIDRVSIPLVVTLHTILEKPSAAERTVLEGLLRRAAK